MFLELEFLKNIIHIMKKKLIYNFTTVFNWANDCCDMRKVQKRVTK